MADKVPATVFDDFMATVKEHPENIKWKGGVEFNGDLYGGWSPFFVTNLSYQYNFKQDERYSILLNVTEDNVFVRIDDTTNVKESLCLSYQENCMFDSEADVLRELFETYLQPNLGSKLSGEFFYHI